ncbi:hypothetical protein N7466_002342 [Penicillium verhagenii]|uniref:uncharacterized protein n=1 Tax=Penicillium verhagenii TaxID=1562060 RepID=UPI002544FEBD|nr:uncharacterized protein N7466_002342 [Penicillium verhagenii]KAJ5939208.1 hypothetical protein N7466_002342 [Penicillium verhagenii]
MVASWAEQTIAQFFEHREYPTQSQCDDSARIISGMPEVRAVDTPGSLSYTVRCIGQSNNNDTQDLIVSFRNLESMIDADLVLLAKSIHGALVPKATYHGQMSGASPPLHIYTMPCLPGISCLETLSDETVLNPEDEFRHTCYVKHLASYFARCWSNPQPVDPQVQGNYKEGIQLRLKKFRESPPPGALPYTKIPELESNLSVLFGQAYPQVFTHGDLSHTNILVDKKTLEITGIVDWSLARLLPFGMELESLVSTTGCMTLNGWQSYTCRQQLLDAFWEEFWIQCRINDNLRQQEIRDMAMQAAKIGAVLHHAFERNEDGSPSERLTTSEWALKILQVACMDY